jgi:hypothetical protein
MGKAIILGVFALALCWAVAHFINLDVISFHVAGIGITRGFLVFGAGVGLCLRLAQR